VGSQAPSSHWGPRDFCRGYYRLPGRPPEANPFGHTRGPHTSSKFEGPKANTGTVTHTVENSKSILRVSADFKLPDTPTLTWRVLDSQGNIFTLGAFKIQAGKGEKREVVVPSYVHDIVRV
jgi:hypothetical protein